MAAAGADAGPEVPLRILHLVARSQRRGAELFALELAAELDALGLRNRVVALGTASDGGREPGLDPLVATPGLGPRDLPARVRAVRALLRAEPVDVVLAHGGWAAQVAALAAPRRDRPLLVWQRIGDLSPAVWRRGRREWWRLVARRFDVGVALTDELAGELRRLGFRGPVWLIPNSRRPDRFRALDRPAAAAALRAELGIGADVPVVTFVGHLDRMKRADRAVAVAAAVRDRGVLARLVVAGDGPLRAELEAQVVAAGLGDRVTFLGRRTDVEQVLGGADLLLLTSDLEGIPGVAIEALMAGLPVVTVPVGGVARVVEDGVTGLVLADADVDGLADAVVGLLADPARRTAMGTAARARTDRFSTATTARTYAASLRAAVAGRGAGRASGRGASEG